MKSGGNVRHYSLFPPISKSVFLKRTSPLLSSRYMPRDSINVDLPAPGGPAMPMRRGRVPFRRLSPLLLPSLPHDMTLPTFCRRPFLARRLRSRTTWSNSPSASSRWLSLVDSISVMARLNDSLSPLSTPSARPRVRGVMLEVEKVLANLAVAPGIDNGGRLMVAPAAAPAAAAAHSLLRMMTMTSDEESWPSPRRNRGRAGLPVWEMRG